MANTVNADLIWEILNSEAITSRDELVANLDDFQYGVDLNPVGPGAQINIPYVTAGATSQTNATNFESGDSTVNDINLAAAQITTSFHLTQAHMNAGLQLRWLLKKNMRKHRNALVDVIFTPVTNAIFGADVADVVAGSFTTAHLQALWAAGKNLETKNLYLDGAWMAELLPTSRESFGLAAGGFARGAYGFDAIRTHNRWDGTSNIAGFLASDDAIAVGTAFPAADPDDDNIDVLYSQDVMIEDLNLPVQFNRWINTATRTRWASVDTMIAASAADTNSGFILGDGT